MREDNRTQGIRQSLIDEFPAASTFNSLDKRRLFAKLEAMLPSIPDRAFKGEW
jgi:hypothetical protein